MSDRHKKRYVDKNRLDLKSRYNDNKKIKKFNVLESEISK